MIKLTRVDNRLLHGQIVYVWVKTLKADSILIASDSVVVDDARKAVIKIAKPQDCKLVIKSIRDAADILNSELTSQYKLIILVETIDDLSRLCALCSKITTVNLGLSGKKTNGVLLADSFYADAKEIDQLKELVRSGIKVEIRQAPNTPVLPFESLDI